MACGSRAGRLGLSSPGAGIKGSGLNPSACSPGIDETGEGGCGPGDDVTVDGGVDAADPREGAAGGHRSGWDSGDCSESVGEHSDG
jgi:hypothetical protein